MAVLILLTPLRPTNAPVQSAGMFLPLVSTQGVADNRAFHRLSEERMHTGAAKEALFRHPEAVVELAMLPRLGQLLSVDMKTAPQTWRHLSRAVRQAIDDVSPESHGWRRFVLHGSGTSGGSAGLLLRYEQAFRQTRDQTAAHHFVIGNGEGEEDGKITATPLWKNSNGATAADQTSVAICLVGDFQNDGPTKAQLQALSELVGYLRMKVGVAPVLTHSHELGRTVSCMGSAFPEVQILDVLNPASSP